MRIANKRQLQSYFCFILLIILVNLGLIFNLQASNKKIEGVIKTQKGKIEGMTLLREVVRLHLQPLISSGQKDKQQNRTSGPSPEATRTTSFVGWMFSTCSNVGSKRQCDTKDIITSTKSSTPVSSSASHVSGAFYQQLIQKKDSNELTPCRMIFQGWNHLR